MRDLLIRRRNLLIRKQEEEMNIRAVCFKADGEQTVAITKVGSAPAITMQYSYDGVNWDAWDLSALPFGGSTKVYVRGVNNAGFATNGTSNTFTFGTDSYVYVSGIAEALLNGEDEVLKYSTQCTFKLLFKDQIALREADRLRFEAMTNSESCYQAMFNGCSNLLSAPELPATTLMPSCYYNMFNGCTSLKSLKCHAKVTASNATYNWLNRVKTSGTFYGHSEYGWPSGVNGIPTTWTFEELTD